MSHITADRVKETTLTTGTGSLTLAGAAVGYRAFSAVCANADTVYYAIELGANWEVGLGTWATGNILARTAVLASSNAGALVNFPAGTKNVFLTLPATAIEAFGGAVSWGALIGTLADQTDLQAELDAKATPASVAAAVAALVDSSPGTLDTLNELAAALGDDANFATTVTNALAAKQPLDADLTAIAAIAPANDDIIQRKAGAWINRTMAQLRADVGVRERLTADRTYAIPGDFATWRLAWQTICESLDINGHLITVNVADGNYDGGFSTWNEDYTKYHTPFGGGSIYFIGNQTTPANIVITASDDSDSACFSFTGPILADVRVLGVTLKLSGRYGVTLHDRANFYIEDYRLTNASTSAVIFYSSGASLLWLQDCHEIVGNLTTPFHADYAGVLAVKNSSQTCVLTGSPVISGQFAKANKGGILDITPFPFSGSATGKRYTVETNGVIDGVDPLPGSVEGTKASGGVYNGVSSDAPLASPTFTDTPAAPTAAVGTDTTQIATTAFVIANAGLTRGKVLALPMAMP